MHCWLFRKEPQTQQQNNMTFRELYMRPLLWQPLNSVRYKQLFSDFIQYTNCKERSKDTSHNFTTKATCYTNFTDIKLAFIDYFKLSKLPTAVNNTRRSYRPWTVWKPEEDHKLIARTVSLSLNNECQATFAPPYIWTRLNPFTRSRKKYQFPYHRVVFLQYQAVRHAH
jgi:hypothetical protein